MFGRLCIFTSSNAPKTLSRGLRGLPLYVCGLTLSISQLYLRSMSPCESVLTCSNSHHGIELSFVNGCPGLVIVFRGLIVPVFRFAVIEANSLSLLHGSPQVMERLSPIEAAELRRR